MKGNNLQQFGGDWTADKLNRVHHYLEGYVQVLKNKHLTTFYIDAFAGTGYNTSKYANNLDDFIEEPIDQDAKTFLDGSARLALKVSPRFNKYVFTEKDPTRFRELEKLRIEFPSLTKDITLVNQDANKYIETFCSTMGPFERAVIFLDPFGMQVPWTTIKRIAETEKIDLWYLFPLGMGVNRMLRRDGNKIPDSWRKRLNEVFGTEEWIDKFYPTQQASMFGDPELLKIDNIAEAIRQFVLKRLRGIFPIIGVAKNPLILRNSKGSPLYLLCFAAGNEKGAITAIKIAEYILGKQF